MPPRFTSKFVNTTPNKFAEQAVILDDMPHLSEIVAQARAVRGWSQTDLAREVTRYHSSVVPAQSIQQLESGKVTNPRYIAALAAALGTSSDALLLGGRRPSKRKLTEGHDDPTKTALPEPGIGYVRLLAIPCGGSETVAYLDVSESWAHANLTTQTDQIQIITAHEDIPSHDITRGDVLFVDSSVRAAEMTGIFTLQRQGRTLIKLLQPMLDGRIAIRSTNPAYETEYVTADQAHDLNISGRVVAAWPLKRL